MLRLIFLLLTNLCTIMRRNLFLELLTAVAEFLLRWSYPVLIGVLMKMYVTLVGALFGLIIGWFAGDVMLAMFAKLGIVGFSMMQIGAFLGFVGSFFGSTMNLNDFRTQKPKEPAGFK